ncbi:FKBP-type peptidyl-prolyl cis-trans isomerase [Chlamydiales bacterium]|nr:FKBP-type peptidyl-prolyl cis-trans isomerase [Chlamydiales bacterium]
MTKVKKGDKVQVDFVATLGDDTIAITTEGREPLELTLGKGEYLAGFEKQILGMKVGDKKKFKLAPEEAFGEYSKEYIATLERSNFSGDMKLSKGMELEFESPEGVKGIVKVISFTDDLVMIDANHAYAGEYIFFSVKLLKTI